MEEINSEYTKSVSRAESLVASTLRRTLVGFDILMNFYRSEKLQK